MHLQGVYVGYQWSNLNPTALMRINYKGGRSWMLMENNRRILSVSGRDLLVACKMTNFKQIRRQAVGFLWLEKMVTSKIRMRKGCHFNFQGTGNDEKLMLVIYLGDLSSTVKHVSDVPSFQFVWISSIHLSNHWCLKYYSTSSLYDALVPIDFLLLQLCNGR